MGGIRLFSKLLAMRDAPGDAIGIVLVRHRRGA